MTILLFILCSIVTVLITMAVINMENDKEFKLSRENLEQFEIIENRLSKWSEGKYNPMIKTKGATNASS